MCEKLLSVRTCLRILDEALADEVLEISGPFILQVGNRVVQYLKQHFLLVRAVSMWGLSICELESKNSERPNINLSGVLLFTLN